MNRRTQINLGDGGQAGTCFSEVSGSTCYSASLPVSIVSTQKVTSTLNSSSKAIVDGFARLTQSQLTSDPQGTDYTDKTYDALGRVSTVSNPYRSTSDPTYGITTTQYDALYRVTKLIPPDGSSSANNVTTSYSGNCTTVTDQTGKSRKSCTDALGRLMQVFEDPAGLNYETDYSFDVLNNLLTVNQKGGTTDSTQWRTPTFTYNSLSQLLTANNPESGTTTYVYDNDGNITTTTSPAPNQTGSSTVTVAYCYDALNRLTSKAYTTSTTCPQTSPVATYLYDQTSYNGLTIINGIGRRTGMADPAGSEAWSYDTMGRPLADSRTTNSVTKTTSYTYNADGSLATLTYPSGRTITYTLASSGSNSAGRKLSAVDVANSINYATAATYAPTGALSSLTNGSGLVSTLYYNSRLQPCRISAKNSGTAPTSCTDSTNIGNVLDFTYNFNLGSSDNGNVIGITNNRVTTRSQTFTYDPLNRIATAQTTSTFATSPANCWGEAYFYDNRTVAGGAWGNLTSIQPVSTAYNGCTQESGLSGITANNKNQLVGYCYDAAGNLSLNTSCPLPLGTSYTPTYNYNAENQLTSTAGVTYTYDGDGRRVQKSSGKLYWYGMGSDPLSETDVSGNLTAEYIFFNGLRIARRDSSNNVSYYLADHLGTSRVITNSSGSILDDSDFYPFGGERVISSSSGNRYKFTAKERDAESGLDNFDFRMLGSTLGRFTSPDPLGGHISNPQSLNRYVYVLNNPLNLIDPLGLEDGSTCARMYDDHGKFMASAGCATSADAPIPPDLGPPGGTPNGVAPTLGPSQGQPPPPALEPGSLPSGNPGAGVASSNSSALNSTQLGLGLLGAIPGPIGTVANLANAGISLYRGNYGEAALNAAFAIPIVGTIGRFARLGEEGLRAAEGVEGIYEFTSASGKTYVGQSANIGRRLAEHLQSGKLLESDLNSARFTEVRGGKLAREIAEQFRIDELGGIEALENVRNAIGQARRYLMVPAIY